jgi:AmmeMemoRadiSam system protein B
MGGHLDHKDPIITYSEDFWETPLGPVELAPEMNAVLNEQVLAFETWSGPTNDNTIEILLPLVKALAPKARIWALRVPPASKALILGSTLAEKYRSKPEKMLLVASTDLTHYGSAYAFAPAGPGDEGEKFRFQNDRTFIEAALALQPLNMILAGIKNRAACSAGAAAATAEAARLLGARSKLLDHYSSRDIMPGEMSVGYAAISYGV